MKKILLVVISLIIVLTLSFIGIWFNPINGDDIVIAGEIQYDLSKSRDSKDIKCVYINRRGDYFIVDYPNIKKLNVEEMETYLHSLEPDGRFMNPIEMISICNWLKHFEDNSIASKDVVDDPDNETDFVSIHSFGDSESEKEIYMLRDYGNYSTFSTLKDKRDQKIVRKIVDNWPIVISDEYKPQL